MKVILTALILVGFLAAAAQATTIDFDDLSGSGSLPSDYAGLIWDSGWVYWDWSQTPYNPHSGTVRVTYYGSSFTFSFPTPVVFNGAWFAGYDTMEYELYLSGGLVATSAQISLDETPQFLNSGYSGFIDEVTLTGVDEGSFGMDDVTYNEIGGQVPEPATFGLLGLGLACLTLLRRL